MAEPVIAAVNAVQQTVRAMRAKVEILSLPPIVGVSRIALVASLTADLGVIDEQVRRVAEGVKTASYAQAERAMRTVESLTGAAPVADSACGVPGCTTCAPRDGQVGESPANGAARKTGTFSRAEIQAAAKDAYAAFHEAAERR